MIPFTSVTGPLAPLPWDDVNTDQICPSSGHGSNARYAESLFRTQRFDADGAERPDFVLNRPEFRAAKLLIAGRNFGCGSGRETAVWALAEAGIRAVIALSFADIFRENCLRNGLLPAVLPPEPHAALMQAAEAAAGRSDATVDLERLCIVFPDGASAAFAFPDPDRRALLKGIDDIGVTLESADEIDAWERRTAARRPWLQTVPARRG